jgi:hypothetical protein
LKVYIIISIIITFIFIPSYHGQKGYQENRQGKLLTFTTHSTIALIREAKTGRNAGLAETGGMPG